MRRGFNLNILGQYRTVRNAGPDMLDLVRNAYRVLLTRGVLSNLLLAGCTAITLEQAGLNKVDQNAAKYPIDKVRESRSCPKGVTFSASKTALISRSRSISLDLSTYSGIV